MIVIYVCACACVYAAGLFMSPVTRLKKTVSEFKKGIFFFASPVRKVVVIVFLNVLLTDNSGSIRGKDYCGRRKWVG